MKQYNYNIKYIIQILQCGGNLFDAVGATVKAALRTTEIPKITAATLDGGEADIQLSDDSYDCIPLETSNCPVIVTLCKVCFCQLTPFYIFTSIQYLMF